MGETAGCESFPLKRYMIKSRAPKSAYVRWTTRFEVSAQGDARSNRCNRRSFEAAYSWVRSANERGLREPIRCNHLGIPRCFFGRLLFLDILVSCVNMFGSVRLRAAPQAELSSAEDLREIQSRQRHFDCRSNLCSVRSRGLRLRVLMLWNAIATSQTWMLEEFLISSYLLLQGGNQRLTYLLRFRQPRLCFSTTSPSDLPSDSFRAV